MRRMNVNQMVKYAKRHRDFGENDLRFLEKQGNGEVSAQASDESRKLYNMASDVRSELQKLKGFLRLDINRHGILYVRHTPENQTEDLLVWHFMYRFPLFTIVLGSQRGTFIGRKKTIEKSVDSMENIVRMLEETLPESRFLRDLGEYDPDTWKSFYDSQLNPSRERKNPKRRIALKHLKMKGFAHEMQRFYGGGLTPFLTEPSIEQPTPPV